MKKLVLLLCLVGLVVLSGCTAPIGVRTDTPQRETPGTETPTPTPTPKPGNPSSEGEIGVENGYTPTENLSTKYSDGLNESEVNSLVNRAMARTEKLRNLEFTQDVPVNFLSRSEFSAYSTSQKYNHRIDVLYEASFLVPEPQPASEVRKALYKGGVTGFYSPRRNELTIIVNQGEVNRIQGSTLAHELVHALQDQHNFSLVSPPGNDASTAHLSLVEGDAQIVTQQYNQKCGSAWNCSTAPTTGGSIPNRKLYALFVFPYIEGPEFVKEMKNECWCNVNEIYNHPPRSTAEVIHPRMDTSGIEYVSLPESVNGVNRTTKSITAGEATIAAMLGGPELAGRQRITQESIVSGVSLDFDLPSSTGWRGDALAGYSFNNSGEGYIWEIKWATPSEATEFLTTYKKLLRFHDATRANNVWHVTDNKYNDYFILVKNGSTTTIYNADTKAHARLLQNNSTAQE